MTNEVNVRSKRVCAGLSQRELAHLVGRSQATLSRCEGGVDNPDIETALALHVVFGGSFRGLFPALYVRIEDAVMARAAELDRKLARRADGAALNIQKLLSNMAKRAGRASAA